MKRLTLRSLGTLLIAGGVITLLYVAYTLWGTGAITSRTQHRLLADLTAGQTPTVGGQRVARGAGSAQTDIPVPKPGDAIAVMRIPRLGASWRWAVVEGVERRYLAEGPGHYPGTAMPGEVGNFAVAGHQVTHGSPFAQLSTMRAGDIIEVDFRGRRYTYVADSTQVVDPFAVGVVLPVPDKPGAKPTKKLITLTTCHPELRSSERFVVYGHLESSRTL